MFPSFFVQPEVSYGSYWIVSAVLTFGFLLRQFKKIVILVSVLLILMSPSFTNAFGGVPGACGTMCMAQWGRSYYPSVYYYPYNYNPYAFYANPNAYYTMLPPWYGGMYPYPSMRGIQSVESPKPIVKEK